jgi:NADH:ubiquinone oxidoreductase subunit E
MPETTKDGIMNLSNYDCYGICSDYVSKIKWK